jgi:hypothetical protein
MMENVIHHHLPDLENQDQIHHSAVQITNHTCVKVENVSETKIIVELNYHVQLADQIDVQIKLVKLMLLNVNHN